mmetsp:Transcript_14223/g.21021  ORF Transcript_14223/g.21021 Transcript_14223/m.21021 type:complete len:101 (-) Transcript_14223:418-720(-)
MRGKIYQVVMLGNIVVQRMKASRLFKDDAFPTELNEDTYTLAYYGITDSGEVLMNELDLEALKESEEKKHDLYEKKISKQENETSIMQEIQRDLRRKGLL